MYNLQLTEEEIIVLEDIMDCFVELFKKQHPILEDYYFSETSIDFDLFIMDLYTKIRNC